LHEPTRGPTHRIGATDIIHMDDNRSKPSPEPEPEPKPEPANPNPNRLTLTLTLTRLAAIKLMHNFTMKIPKM
jgi:hypothetical protein